MWKISDFQFEFGTRETFEETNPVDFLACWGTRNSNTVKGKTLHSWSEKDDFDGIDRWKFLLGESLFAVLTCLYTGEK